MSIYYIGGSPCSGKSTVAEALCTQYGLTYFKVDDHLDEFTALGAAEGLPICQRILGMSPEENWMRPPQEQCREELDYYTEIAPFVREEIQQLPTPVLAEGAAFLPSLMQAQGVPADRYIAIIPSEAFQISRYRLRPWVPHVLQGCADPDAAFANWMARDVLFAQDVRQQSIHAGYTCLITDGSVSPAERLAQLSVHFQLAGICQKQS